jgi:hypothetical protein
MDRYSNEKDMEICAVKLNILSHTILIITVYRSPTGNMAYFFKSLEAALNQYCVEILILITTVITRIRKL